MQAGKLVVAAMHVANGIDAVAGGRGSGGGLEFGHHAVHDPPPRPAGQARPGTWQEFPQGTRRKQCSKIETIADLPKHIGQKLGSSDWLVVDQKMIDKFAEATGDHQWIHIDVERAKKEMPGGKTIAHGYLTLSLLPKLAPGLEGREAQPRGQLRHPTTCASPRRSRPGRASAAT